VFSSFVSARIVAAAYQLHVSIKHFTDKDRFNCCRFVSVRSFRTLKRMK